MINNGFVSKEIIDDFFLNSDNMDSENKFSLIEKHQKEILNIVDFYQEYVNSLFLSIEKFNQTFFSIIDSISSIIVNENQVQKLKLCNYQ